ncbi:ATP-binding protein [Pseudomonas putida]|uniref:hybrid sensor histidine kinase/response regulator n=1 Tax=Pseudomonas putida TaxID=303 RepID=UPI003D013C79
MAATTPTPRPNAPAVLLAPNSTSGDLPGKYLAGFDWSRTPLGPLPRWPATLRIAVDMMLASPFPSAVVWGGAMTVVCNAAYLALGGAAFDALGQRFDEVWRGAWENMGPWVFKVMEGQSSFIEDQPVCIALNDKGDTAYFAFSYSPVRDENGDVAGFLHTVIDSTASVAAREAWRCQTLSFEAQIARYMADREHIWELSRDAMVMVTRELKFHAANPALYRILGWSEEQMMDLPILDMVHPADRTEVQVAVIDVVHGKLDEPIETRLRHQDGHYRRFRWTAKFDGERFTAVGRDITAEREEAMRQAEALIRDSQRLEAVGQLAGGMAHEMNNLLSGIGGSLELLQRRLAQGRTEGLESYTSLALDSVQRAMGLTHRLLAFSRKQPLAPRPLDINRHLSGVEPLLRQTLGAEMRLQWQLDVLPWPVFLDTGQLDNALINLCANARDACLERGSVTIRSVNERLVSAFPEEGGLPPGDYVALHIEDTGHGMSSEEISRAFEPFFTSKPVGRGAGLGLAMVYGFVRQSGGYVWIESSPGAGARVSMLFPRSPEVLPPEPSVPPPSDRPAEGQRVLLVDDELNLRTLMREYLDERGFIVADALDANGALERFQQDGPFDLVITDIGLPGGFSGRQLAKTLRMLNPEQKILFITGFTDAPIEPRLLEQPGTALMLKPFSLESLACKAVSMLGG